MLKIGVIRTFNEVRYVSMKLYADNLIDSLKDNRAFKIIDLKAEAGKKMNLDPDSRSDHYVKYMSFVKNMNQEIDLFHVVDHAESPFVRVLNKPKMITCHDLAPLILCRKYGKFSLATISSFFRMKLLNRFDKIIAVSENTKRDLIRLGTDPGKIEIILEGLFPIFNKDLADQDILAKYGINKNSQILLHAGGNSFRKNVDIILRSMTALSKDIIFIKLGKKLNSKQNRFIRNQDLQDRVFDIGHVDKDDLRSFYKISDIVVFPSLYEGFGFPVLEAMSQGTPVISSDTGSLKEVGGDACLYIEPHDRSRLIHQVETLLTDQDLRAKLISFGFERVRTLTWEKHVEGLRTLYGKYS